MLVLKAVILEAIRPIKPDSKISRRLLCRPLSTLRTALKQGTADTREELQLSSVCINLCPWKGQSEDEDEDFGFLCSLFKMRKVPPPINEEILVYEESL